jgi:hypothetical protein
MSGRTSATTAPSAVAPLVLGIARRRAALRFLIATWLRARVRSRRAASAGAAILFSLAPHPLLELLDFLLQEAAGNRFLSVARLVVAAIGAAPPTFRIRFLAGRAEDAPGQRHRGAHCTLPP